MLVVAMILLYICPYSSPLTIVVIRFDLVDQNRSCLFGRARAGASAAQDWHRRVFVKRCQP